MRWTSLSGSAIGLTTFTGPGTGAVELTMSGLQDIGNGTITTNAGITATINRAIEAGGGIAKNARSLTNLRRRQIFREPQHIMRRGSDLATDFFCKLLRFDSAAASRNVGRSPCSGETLFAN